jgi:hypothetical protein
MTSHMTLLGVSSVNVRWILWHNILKMMRLYRTCGHRTSEREISYQVLVPMKLWRVFSAAECLRCSVINLQVFLRTKNSKL